ncbi:hypothetical protein AB0F09_18710 [Streptomyces olivaceus]|uniref:hypothetical protein n=1 Tax=Streptomyces olivaceus TaxID=47716 RepID=UPI0033C47299
MSFPVDGYTTTSVLYKAAILDLDWDRDPVLKYETRVDLTDASRGTTQDLLDAVNETVLTWASNAVGPGNYATIASFEYTGHKTVDAPTEF